MDVQVCSNILDTVVVRFVFHDGIGWEIEYPLQCVSDSGGNDRV